MGTVFSCSHALIGKSMPSPPGDDDLVSSNVHGIGHQWFGRRAPDILPIEVENTAMTRADDLPLVGRVLDGTVKVRTSRRKRTQVTFNRTHKNSGITAKLENLAGIRLDVVEASSRHREDRGFCCLRRNYELQNRIDDRSGSRDDSRTDRKSTR